MVPRKLMTGVRSSYARTAVKVLPVVALMVLLAAVQGCGGGRQSGYGGYGGGGGEGFWGGLPYNYGFQRAGVGEVLLSLIFGALFGAFISPRLAKYRKYLFLTILVIGVLDALFFPSPLCDAGWWLIGCVGAVMVLNRLISPGPGRPKDTTFGSAEWATLDHLRSNSVIGDNGFLLGWFEANGVRHPLSYAGDRHLLTVAPTRAGKGVSAIIPNLLTYKGSALVIDPKGENAMITARQREALGQKVFVVDPWETTGVVPARFNPLDWLRPEDPDVGENALMLADAIVVRSAKGENAFWDDESVALLWGMILYVALDPEPKTDRTLGGVRDLINLGPASIKALLAEMQKHPNSIVRSTAERTLGKEEKVFSNVFSSVQAQTHFLDSPRIRESMSRSDFAFEDLKTSRVTVFLVLPADRLGPFGRWLRLLIQQAITVNARNIEVKPDKPILFMLDEMAALGKLTKVEEAYGLMAGFGMQLWGIVQDLGQLDRIYDKGWETFIGNSGVLQYFGSRDGKTASYFSKLCGMSTIQKFSISRTISRTLDKLGMSSGSSTSQATTEDVVQRPLAFPDELMVFRRDESLLLVENLYPIKGRKRYWYNDDQLRRLGTDIRGGVAPPLGVASTR